VAGGGRYLIAVLLAGCSSPEPAACPAPLPMAEYVYVRGHGWHVEVGLAARSITGPLSVFLDVFPGAQAIMFGYGKRTFITAPPDSLSEYLLGPVPGPAVIQVTGLAVLPDADYPAGEVLMFPLPPGGARALSDFIWRDIAKDKAGEPRLVGPGPFVGSLFYSAVSGYRLSHTCNTWAALAMNAAGVPLDPGGIVFSNQVVDRAITAGACAPPASSAGGS
jgi:hypothetical protein